LDFTLEKGGLLLKGYLLN